MDLNTLKVDIIEELGSMKPSLFFWSLMLLGENLYFPFSLRGKRLLTFLLSEVVDEENRTQWIFFMLSENE